MCRKKSHAPPHNDLYENIYEKLIRNYIFMGVMKNVTIKSILFISMYILGIHVTYGSSFTHTLWIVSYSCVLQDQFQNMTTP